MPLYTTPDGRYTYAIETPNEGDGNSVVYDNWRGPTAVWDRWSYEAELERVGHVPTTPPSVAPSPVEPPVGPLPDSPLPVPSAGGGPVIRVTDERDGEFINRGYSYWPQAWITGDLCYVFAGHRDLQPRFFRVNLATGSVERLGPLLGDRYRGEGEGLYWNHGWIYYCKGMELRRASPFAENDERAFTIEGQFPFLCDLWQAHSDDAGETHCATVRRVLSNGDTEKWGTVVYWRSDVKPYPARMALADESQIDPTGGYLVIKETIPGVKGVQNRIIALSTGETRTLTNATGAVGHSDLGPGLLVGEWSPQQGEDVGQIVLWDLRQHLVPERRKMLLPTWNMGHLSYGSGKWLRSDDTNLSLVAIDGSGETVLGPHGMIHNSPDPYDTQCFANIDVTGTVAAYVSNEAGRMDLYLRRLP